MTIDTNTVVSISEANQNFSRVCRMVDNLGKAVVFKNNSPKYMVLEFSVAERAVSIHFLRPSSNFRYAMISFFSAGDSLS